AAVTICRAQKRLGRSWYGPGILVGQTGIGIMRVAAASGGKPETVVPSTGIELLHGPSLLPDGEHVMFTLATGLGPDRWDNAKIVVQSLKSGERKALIEGGSDARYVATGRLL